MNAILTDGSIAIKDAKKLINEHYEVNEYTGDMMFNHFIILPLWHHDKHSVINEIKYDLVKELSNSGLTAEPIINKLNASFDKLHVTVSLLDIKDELEYQNYFGYFFELKHDAIELADNSNMEIGQSKVANFHNKNNLNQVLELDKTSSEKVNLLVNL